MIHKSAATPSSIAPGTSSVNVMRNGGSGRISVAPSGTRSAAAKAGTGASASSDGMRSLARRDVQATSIASGAASEAASSVAPEVMTHNPARDADCNSSKPHDRCARTANLQQF